jgi:hypothetical protein
MAVKRYSSACSKFAINVKDKKGKPVCLVFDRYNPDAKRRFLDVENIEYQEQIEKSPDFKVYFRLDFIFPETDMLTKEMLPNASVCKEEITIENEPQPFCVKLFANVNEAKKWLNEQGIPFNKIPNKDKVVSEGKAIGYEIVFETK